MDKLSKIAKTVIESHRKLTVPEKHQLKIALKTLKMNDVGAKVMGGMGKAEAVKFLKSIGYSDQKIKQLSEAGSPYDDRDMEMSSDISETWLDPVDITKDVREYLMMLYQEQAEDYKIEDAIDAIEHGIREFRKITNV